MSERKMLLFKELKDVAKSKQTNKTNKKDKEGRKKERDGATRGVMVSTSAFLESTCQRHVKLSEQIRP